MMTDDAELRPPQVGRLNEAARFDLLKLAEGMREQIVGLAYDAVVLFLDEDNRTLQELTAAGYPEGAEAELYVLDDLYSAPFSDGEPVRTLSILLERDSLVDDDTLDEEGIVIDDEELPLGDLSDTLRVFLPIPRDTVIDENFDPSTLPKSDTIYVERMVDRGEAVRYIISKEGMEYYISAADTGEEFRESDAFEERLASSFARRVETGLPFMANLHEDFINMNVIPQRTIRVGDAAVEDRGQKKTEDD